MFGNNIVKNGKIHQEVLWNTPVLKYNEFPEYIIRYADSGKELLSNKANFKHSSKPNTTLQLTFGTSNITYNIAVAVKSTAKQERGDYSDTVSIDYTSESTHADCFH